MSRGPGLVKSRPLRLLAAREVKLVKLHDPRWRELLETADSVSEGSARVEAEGRIWYGSTSLIVAMPDRTAAERTYLAGLAGADPHLRLRVTRMARHEAAARAPRALGRALCELTTSADPRGLRIDVDIQAPLIEGRGRARPVPSP